MKIPGFIVGSVRVPIPKINVWLGVLAIPLTFVAEISGHWTLLAVGVGLLMVMPIAVGLHWLAQWRFTRKVAHWPVQVQVMPGPEGERVAFVTTHDGSVLTLLLPDDYDPSDDDGEWFIRQVAPDLAEAIYEDEEEPGSS